MCFLQFEKAYFEFESQLEDFKPLVGEELYTDTLHQIMVQVALQNLRGRVGAVSVELVDDLKERFEFVTIHELKVLALCMSSPLS